MQPVKKNDPVQTAVKLTDDQRNALARTLGIDVELVPRELGVVGVPEMGAKALGMPNDMRGRFSPSVVLM